MSRGVVGIIAILVIKTTIIYIAIIHIIILINKVLTYLATVHEATANTMLFLHMLCIMLYTIHLHGCLYSLANQALVQSGVSSLAVYNCLYC